MAKREIGTSLKLDGEAQFKAAITNINQELRVLSSEMGAAVSSFDKSGASISDLKSKGDIYARQLDSQKEKLSVLQSAVETARTAQEKAIQTAAEMAEKYGANSDEAKKASEAVAAVTKKLNDYQIQANNTTKNINQLEAAQRANTTELENFQSKLDSAQIDKLTNNIKSFDSELNLLASELGKVTSSYDKNKASAENLNRTNEVLEKQSAAQKEKQQALNAAISEASNILQSAKIKAAEMADTYGENSVEAENAAKAVTKAENALNDYQIQANNTTKNINQLEAAQKANNKEIDKLRSKNLKGILEGIASGAKSAADGIAKIASAAAKITTGAIKAYTASITAASAAVVGLAKSSIETGKAFDSSMSQVAATMGTTVDQIDYLADAAKEMGATTSFTASEAADGLNILAMAGMDMKEAVTASADSASLLETTLNMASAGALSLEDSAGYLTGTLKGFGDEASNAQYYADLMAKGATLANTSVSDLGAGLSGISATASSYGQSADAMTLSLLKLADANVTGDKAATSLKAALSNLYTPTDTAKKALDELGVSAYDEYGKARDLNTVVDELSNALSGLSDQEANAYKNSIFGIQGLDAFNKMANTSTDSVEKFKTGLAEASGSTAEQAATQLNNLEGDITLLGSAADGAKMAIYDALNGTDSRLRQFVQQVTEEVSLATSAFEAGGFYYVLERLYSIIPEIAENIVNGISEILPTFLECFNELVFTIVQSISDSLPTAVNSILPAMINGCTSLVSGLVQKIPSFVPTVLKGAVTLFKGILDGLNQVITQMTSMLPQIVSDISSVLVSNIPALISGAAQFFAGIVTAIAEVIPSIITAVVEIVPLICNSIIENIPLLIDAGLQLFVSLTEALPDAIVQIVAALPEIINGIISALLEAVPQIIQAGIDLFVALIGALPEIITTIVEALPQIITGIVTAIAGAIPQLVEAGMNLFLGLIGALPDIIIAIVNAIPQITDGVVGGLIEAAPQLAIAGLELFIAIVSNLPKIIMEIVSVIPKIIKGIADGFKERLSDMSEIGSNIMAGIGDGIISGVTAVKEKISAAGEKIMNAFKDFFGIHSPSTKMKEEVGYNLADGTAEGFIEQMERNVDDMNAAVPKDYTIGINITDEKSAKKAIDTIVTDYKKGRLSQQQADALTVSVYKDCEQQKIQITEYALEKITAARKDVSDKNREQLGKDLKSEITAYEKQIEELQKSIQKTADNLTESYKSMYTFEKDEDGNIISAKVTNKMREATKELDNFNAEVEKLQERGISSGLLNQLDGMSKDEGIAVAEYWNTLNDKQLKALEKNWEKYQRSANQLSERLHAEETEKAARDMLENINAVITDSSAVLDDMGLQIMAGLREGMTGTAANKQIKDVCDSIISRFKNYFGIASPSKVMKKEVGLNLADGVGVGFTEQMSKISADMQKSVPTHFDLDVEVDSAATARKRHMSNSGSDRGGFSYTQIINSPKALDTATINRQTRQGLQLASVIR